MRWGRATKLREHDDISGSTLRTVHLCRAVPLLFLIHPPLEAGLVDPLGGTSTATGLHPFSIVVIFHSGKANPAAPPEKQQNTSKWYTFKSVESNISLC